MNKSKQKEIRDILLRKLLTAIFMKEVQPNPNVITVWFSLAIKPKCDSKIRFKAIIVVHGHIYMMK